MHDIVNLINEHGQLSLEALQRAVEQAAAATNVRLGGGGYQFQTEQGSTFAPTSLGGVGPSSRLLGWRDLRLYNTSAWSSWWTTDESGTGEIADYLAEYAAGVYHDDLGLLGDNEAALTAPAAGLYWFSLTGLSAGPELSPSYAQYFAHVGLGTTDYGGGTDLTGSAPPVLTGLKLHTRVNVHGRLWPETSLSGLCRLEAGDELYGLHMITGSGGSVEYFSLWRYFFDLSVVFLGDGAAAPGGGGSGGSGSVTSVGLSMPSGFSVSGSPVTSSGTLTATTSLSGIIKGTGSGLAAAVANTDYSTPGGVSAAIAAATIDGGTW